MITLVEEEQEFKVLHEFDAVRPETHGHDMDNLDEFGVMRNHPAPMKSAPINSDILSSPSAERPSSPIPMAPNHRAPNATGYPLTPPVKVQNILNNELAAPRQFTYDNVNEPMQQIPKI
eukprot:UN32440